MNRRAKEDFVSYSIDLAGCLPYGPDLPNMPEIDLAIAVLGNALQDIAIVRGTLVAPPDVNKARLHEETDSWIRSNSRGWLYSFLSLCEILNLDPESMREALLRRLYGKPQLVEIPRMHASGPRKPLIEQRVVMGMVK